MKKIIFAALLSLTAILIIASCSSEVTKAKYQTEINEIVTKYLDDESVAYSTTTDVALFGKVTKAKKNVSEKITVTVNEEASKGTPIDKVTYIFTTNTSSKFTTNTCTVTWSMDSEKFEEFKDCFEDYRVSGLKSENYLDIEAKVRYVMTDSQSRTAFENSLKKVIDDERKEEAIKKSAAIFAELSTSSDLIVNSLKEDGKRDETKLEACTAVLNACYKYFSDVAKEDSSVTKANLLSFELLESYIDIYSWYYAELINNSSYKITDPDVIELMISRAEIIDEITKIGVADYITKIFK